jgi:phospholipid N-methyltransferase
MGMIFKPNGTSLFFKEALRKPIQIGALSPSSRSLAKAMAKWLPQHYSDWVLELGPGTGAITHSLLRRGLRPEKLVAVEISPNLTKYLSQKYPQVRILLGDALQLPLLISKSVPQAKSFQYIFSSLPLCNFPEESTEHITQNICSLLKPDGLVIQYSYRLDTLKARRLPNLSYQHSELVWFNFPPVRVSVYRANKSTNCQ